MLALLRLSMLGLVMAAGSAEGAPRRIAAAYDDPGGGGRVVALRAAEPWDELSPALSVGAGPTLRSAYGRLYAVSRSDATLTVIDTASWTIEQVVSVGVGTEPIDVAIIDPGTALVSRRGIPTLLKVDLDDWTTQPATDLSMLADADGNPEMGFMAIHEGRLLVALERFSDGEPFGFIPPATLAVVDLSNLALVDVDPATSGVQGIELVGTAPKHKMQLLPGSATLHVSASGTFFDAGGLESVDLATLQTQGLVLAEAEGLIGADLGSFAYVEATRGYLVFSTDLIESTHLVEFTTAGFVGAELLSIVAYRAPVLVHDPIMDLLYLPQAQNRADGVNVFAAGDGTRLTPNPIPLAGPPTDLAMVCDGVASCVDPHCPTTAGCLGVPATGPTGGALLITGLAVAAWLAGRRSWLRGPGLDASA